MVALQVEAMVSQRMSGWIKTVNFTFSGLCQRHFLCAWCVVFDGTLVVGSVVLNQLDWTWLVQVNSYLT